jgi:hypothetical protein
MKRTIAAMAISMTFSGILSAQAPPAPPKPGPEHQRLAPFVGSWTFVGDMKPGPMGQGGKMTGTDQVQWLPGNFFIERRFEGTDPMGKSSGLEIIGYDPVKKTYAFTFVDSMGSMTSGTMTVNGNTWTTAGTGTRGGHAVQERCTLAFGADSRTLKIACDASGDGKKWAPVFEGTATKK